MDSKTIDQVTYNELRKEAKKLGIPANGKKEQLWTRVLEGKQRKRKAEEAPEEEPKTKIAKLSHAKDTNNEDNSSANSQEVSKVLPRDLKTKDPDQPEVKTVTRTTEHNNAASFREAIQYLLADPKVSTQDTNNAIKKLTIAIEKSSDLVYQQGVYGTCLKVALPLRETLKFENYFSDDIVGTEIYKQFVNFVQGCQVSTLSKQTLRLGAVVQVSGYGKTHLARVYTRHNKGIYIKFSERQSASSFYKAINTTISGLQQKHLPADINHRTGENYIEFTEMAGRAVEIFFLAAIEHYIYFYHMISESNDREIAEADVIKMCALLFDIGFANLFLLRVNDYWKNIDNESWYTLWKGKVRDLASAFGLRAIFCDEVHALQSLYIGHFCHTSPPPVWSNKLCADRAAYEQHIVMYPEDKNSDRFHPNVRNAYKRSMTLTYLTVAMLEHISEFIQIGCILLTTDHAAIDYTSESSLATRDRATMREFTFTHNVVEDAARYNELIRTHFGIDLDTYLQTLPDYTRIKETLGNRAVYFNWALFATIVIAQSSKPANLNASLPDIWKTAEESVLIQANDFLLQMELKTEDAFKKVVYAALYHNGYLPDNTLVTSKEIDIGYLPVITEKSIGGVTRYCLTDYWMIKQIYNTANRSLHLKALEHRYHLAKADGPLGEDLMKFIVMTNQGKTFSALAVKGSTFHENSIAHQCRLQVLYAADASEFELSAMDVLTNPNKHLKHRLVKVCDTVHPDGLTISDSPGGSIISAWQSKHYLERLDAAAIEVALKSLDPTTFFHPNSSARAEWDAIRKDTVWHDKYIRVIWATDFTESAISAINKYNDDSTHINRPIVLMSHELLPEEFAQKFVNLPQSK